jgi:hypothetical protein
MAIYSHLTLGKENVEFYRNSLNATSQQIILFYTHVNVIESHNFIFNSKLRYDFETRVEYK